VSTAYLVDGVRTPIGRYGGALSGIRPDDLAATVLRALTARQPSVDWADLDDVVLGATNQAGEDNRNVARMALLLSGLPEEVPGTTINRLCGSGADAVAVAARAIRSGEQHLVIAGGVESMSRAPFVHGKADKPFSRTAELFDTTLGWRFVNPELHRRYGTDTMGQTAENVAADYGISRADQDAFALRSQERTAMKVATGTMAEEIHPVERQDGTVVDADEHPRATTLAKLASLRPAFREGGTVTAGNSSGINDGAAALLLASQEAVERYQLTPIARISGAATAGVAPRVMGVGPIPATAKLLARTGLDIASLDVIELNEAFAAQSLAVIRDWRLPDDAEHVNPGGGAIALGHPVGMSGARLVLTAALEIARRDARRALATMCIGVGQGISVLIERP
jgi:acetyl-CoA C-acetyltransferase/acetyl-CoA acyltransferase